MKLSDLFNNYRETTEEFSLLPHTGDYLSTDVFEENGNIIVEMDLSGLEAEDIDIYVEGNELHVSGNKEEISEEHDNGFQMKEVLYGSFDRLITLPNDVDTENLEADFEDGILTINIPKIKEKRKRSLSARKQSKGKEYTSARSRNKSRKSAKKH